MDYQFVFIANVIANLACSAIGFLYMYGVVRHMEKHKQTAARYFMLFFLLAGLGYLALVIRNWTPAIYSVVINNGIYLLIFHFLALGVLSWYRIRISCWHLALVVVHVLGLMALQGWLHLTVENSFNLRTYIAFLNISAVLLSMLLVCWRHRATNRTGERIITLTLLLDIVAVSVPSITVCFYTPSNPYIFMEAVMVSQIIINSLTLGALLSLFLFDQIGLHYEKSIRDELSGLHNRRYFGNQLRQLFEAGSPAGAVALIDIDHFKKINDEYGHDVGDRVIRNIARMIAGVSVDGVISGRYGGEEFILYLPYGDEVGRILENLRAEIATCSLPSEPAAMPVTASLGYAPIRSEDHLEEVIKRADIALYKAKRVGRNCVVIG
ncbi:GGDEF domain-containing protein [Oceanobacter mangrovi]|uniref:GGDEF domain-containing protein n=1 Tax=Oceanobacter mangrovi TaxID=2862510 RepID=UPI001C8D4B1A|nr:GGDEF domain-containing protein [Oceanobacter mangrovi]